MAHNVESMDLDCMDSEFDDKENTFHHSNLLPCTEKGYEELDVSEINMRLRYSTTPAASPMSKSYTAYTDNRNLDSNDSLNCTVENNLTRSLNSTITKNDSVNKSLKTLPLQSLPTEFGDRISVLRPLDTTVTNSNVTVTLSEAHEIDENLSLPSTSSSVTHTPEATTPVNDIKNDNRSPIMRGLKTVLNMFRPSQSPIPPTEGEDTKPELSSNDSIITEEKPPVLASTPIAAQRNKDGTSSRKNSPLKDSITFNDDLEKELQWKDETTIFFNQEKVPINKLFFQNTKSDNVPYGDTAKPVVNDLNSTLEYMDISYDDCIVNDKTLSEIQADLATDKNEVLITAESDGEFVDCETTFTNESQIQDTKEITPETNDPLLDAAATEIESTNGITEEPINDSKSVDIPHIEEPSKDSTNPLQEMREVANSTISIIQELDSLLEGNDSKKDVSLNKKLIDSTASEKLNEKEDQKKAIPDAVRPPITNSEIDNIQSEEAFKLEPILTPEQQVVLESKDLNPKEIPLSNEAKPADVPLPDEDDIEKELKPTDVLETLLPTNAPDFVEFIQAEATSIISDFMDKIVPTPTQENKLLPEESVPIKDGKINNDILNAVVKTLPNEANKEEEKTEIKSLEIVPKDANKTVKDLNALPDLVNQTISNEQRELEVLKTQNSENILEIINEIQEIPVLGLPKPTIPHLDSSPIKHLDFNPTVPSVEQNDAVLTHCNVNSTIALENKIDDELKDTTVCILQENFSVNILNANDTDNEKNNVTMVIECNSDVLQHNLTVTNEDKVTKGLSTEAENPTVISTVPIDNKSDVKADISEQYKLDTTLENNGDTTVVIDIRKDVEFNEMANSRSSISKPDITQKHYMDSLAPTETIVCNEHVNKTEISNTRKSPNSDGEIIVSENNSPYVSVMAGINTELKTTKDNFETPENINTVPSSPPIVSKGYNFNFDEIDNPFATKTNIRLSPPPSKNTELKDTPNIEFGMPKKAPINRRKSQPPERKKTAMNKKKFNTTIDAKLPNDEPKIGKETLEPIVNLKHSSQNDNLNDLNSKPDEYLDEVTKIDLKSSDSNDIKENFKIKESETCHQNDQSLKLEDGKENKLDQKSSGESSITNNSDFKTSSSEQSTYFSAVASSTESSKSKNVFNLPEIDDVNFNPFAMKSNMRQSPPPLELEENPFVTKTKIKSSPDSSMVLIYDKKENTINKINMDVEDKMDFEQMEKEVDISNASSKTADGPNLTHEINTEDEDTEEGPFLEVDDALDKASILGDDEFNRLPTHNEDNLEAGEMFIDAETFEFLLNQNKTNMVADSGKESLFLKFDPLFAKKISSDGVVAALSRVQKRQSTPTRARPSLRNDASPIAGPSNINVTYEANLNASADESTEDFNITVSKPTMIVTPAINPAMTPRNKSITPNRSNRRSITFTSPAMAVIDRLLSMSANNSLDTTVTQSQTEADLALAQLRELLAEKEIDVYNLKAESMELKERLNTMESQVKLLEADGNERLKKINELNSQLAEKSKINKSMAAVVEEYERTIASLIAETAQDKKRHAEERMRLINERDEQTAHLGSMEASFSDLHSKYEKSKQVILNFKANEEAYEKSIKDFEESLTKMQNNYEMLKQHATSKLNHANSELEKMNKAHEAEVLKLNALLKRNALHITSLEETLAQKTKANDELTAICDELINKVG